MKKPMKMAKKAGAKKMGAAFKMKEKKMPGMNKAYPKGKC